LQLIATDCNYKGIQLQSVAIIKEAANRQAKNGIINQKQNAASTTTEVATEGPPVEATTSTDFRR